MSRIRRSRGEAEDYWPGFVDALATLLLVVVFLLALFIAAQFTLGRVLSSKDAALEDARSRLLALADMLALEKTKTNTANDQIARLQVTLQAAKNAATAQAAIISGLQTQIESGTTALAQVSEKLAAEQQLSKTAQTEITALTAQLAALNAQLASLRTALEAAEAKDATQKTQIVNLGKRLNAALARQVSELARYKSEFLAKMLTVMADREGVRIEGDRFVFESDVLFASASAELNEAGEQQLAVIANAIIEIAEQIPSKIEWVIRVDGHTDVVPIRSKYASNWELSTARALSVVRFFEAAGVPPTHLAAAGFGQYHPLDRGRSAEALAKNRRIELKMDSR
ncbi:MotB-like protein Atu3746 [hydrothermal vent metagenome]|uniref:MotB-like protein Atu3746 n=1 Tax=hydrothermal vent metagenome TaxID=652676 RepID=A0A3B0R754_9ZZZZ